MHFADLATYLSVVFVLGTLLMILQTPTDMYRASKQAKWPSVVATIKQQAVRKYTSGRSGDVWRIDSEVRYTVDGETLTSNIHSHVGGFREQRAMRAWASQHPPGTPLPIRYDPEHRNTIILDAGDMPQTGHQVADDLKMLLFFSALSLAFITIGRVLRSRREKSSVLNHDNTNE